MNTKIKWDPVGEEADDFFAKSGKYTLRVEQMSKKRWWWCVYLGDNSIAFDDPQATTQKEAKLLAENAFLRHLIQNQGK